MRGSSQGRGRRGNPDVGPNLGETLRTIGSLEQQLSIAREVGDRRGEAQALLTMGSIYVTLGAVRRTSDETRRGVECLDQAIRIFRQIADRLGEGQCLWQMCMAFVSVEPDSRPNAQTIDLARVALRIFRQFGDPTAELVQIFLTKWEGQAAGNKK